MAAAKSRKKKKSQGGWLKVLGWLFFLAFIGIIIGIAGLLWLLYVYGTDVPDHRQLANYDPPVTTRLYAGDGRLLIEYAQEKRVFVPIDAIPKRVIGAFLSAEDKNFYQHEGLDFLHIANAVYVNILHHFHLSNRVIGGSTITQQVAKNFLLNNERTYSRKLKEVILALRIEQTYSKDRILELYLNQIYLGGGSYGVAAAAQDYFNKSLDELTISEMAYLAALPKGPNNYSLTRNKKAAIIRRDYVINEMRADGYISYKEKQQALAEDLVAHPRTDATYVNAEYFAEEVRRDVAAQYGDKSLYNGGLSVHTTLDPHLQQIATHSLRYGIEQYDRRHGWRGPIAKLANPNNWQAGLAKIAKPAGSADWQLAAILKAGDKGMQIGLANGSTAVLSADGSKWAGGNLRQGYVVLVSRNDNGQYDLHQIPKVQGGIVALDPHTGRVLAMTGGFDPALSSYNRAVQAKRQPGSAFKPFVYLTAMEKGFRPNTLILDAPISYSLGNGQGDYSPGNYEDDFMGPITVRKAVEKSRNVPTVRTASYIGMKNVAQTAKDFGIMDNMPNQLAMALGAGETTLLKMVTAYGELDNGGKKITPTLIDRIQDKHGKTIYSHDARICEACKAPSWGPKMPVPIVPDNRTQIVDAAHAYQTVSILEGVVQRGTASSLKELGRPLAGKTGTTNDSKDVWFIGMTPDLVVGAYIGYDQPKTLGKHETGAQVALPVVKEFFKQALADQPSTPFRVPPGIRLARVNPNDGSLARVTDPAAIWEAFIPGTEPDPDHPEARPVLGSGAFNLPGVKAEGSDELPADIAKQIGGGDEDKEADNAGDNAEANTTIDPNQAPTIVIDQNNNSIVPRNSIEPEQVPKNTSNAIAPPPTATPAPAAPTLQKAPLSGTGGLY